MALRLDHLIVTAPELAIGVAALESVLGVSLGGGGRHALMGTHNALLRLGTSLYLEVIAPDPQAAPPGRPRWFGLDDPPALPRLAHWAVASDDIEADAAQLGFAPDEIIEMARGDYRWRITVPHDGRLPVGDALPSLIQWQGRHPAAALPDAGCGLARLTCRSAQAGKLRRLGLEDERLVLAAAGVPPLAASLDTPHGPRALLAAAA